MQQQDEQLAELNALFDFDSDHHYQNLACWSALTTARSFAKTTHDKYQSLLALLKTLQSESFKWSGVNNTIDSAGNLQSRIDTFPYTLEVVSFANQKNYLTNNRESDEVAKQYNLPNISSRVFLSLADELDADTIGELELFLATNKKQREKFFEYMTSQPFFDFQESVLFDEFDDWHQVRLEQKALEKLVSTKEEKKKQTNKI